MTKIRLMKKGRADNQTRGDSVLKMDGFISNTSEHIDYPQKTMYRLIAETSENIRNGTLIHSTTKLLHISSLTLISAG